MKHYATRAAAQRAANRANDQDRDAFWVVGCDSDGWYIENLNAMAVYVPSARERGLL
jgi:hypothetical protein